MSEGVALIPKTYCYDKFNIDRQKESTDRRPKGIPQRCAKGMFVNISKEALFDIGQKRGSVIFNSIRSKSGQIYAISFTKLGIANYDNNRYWCVNLTSRPCGHDTTF